MKKIIVLILAVLLTFGAVSVCTGCSGNKSDDSGFNHNMYFYER